MSEIFQAVAAGLSGWNLVAIFAGTAWGILAGALPGITGAIGVALILPFTFGMSPGVALGLLTASYAGSMFGGSISSILLGAPGTTSAAATLMDGYPLHKQGKSGLALGTALCGSTIGGIFGSLVLITFCTPLAKVALLFGPPEYFALGLFGLTVLSALSKSLIKGFISGIFGMMVASVGIDKLVGLERYTFGMFDLVGGVEFLPALIGLFALSEMFIQGSQLHEARVPTEEEKRLSMTLPSLSTIWGLRKSISIGAVIGTIIGIMPGAGGSIGSWVAYAQAQRFSATPEEFGKGCLEGIAAPEAANNASEGGALIPMLALGIPGSNTTAIMLGALTLQGITPGPSLFTDMPEVVWSIYASCFLANFVILSLGFFILKPVLKITTIPVHFVVSSIIILLFTAAFAIKSDPFDLWVMLVFGLIGLLMKRFKFSVPAAVLGMVLGPIIELSLQRSLMISHGDWTVFFTRPVSLGFMVLTALSFAYGIYANREKPKVAAVESPA